MKASWGHRVGAAVAVLFLSAMMAKAQDAQLLVSNVQAQQRPFTAIWDVTYDLESIGDIEATVSLSLSTDSGTTYPYVCAMVTGDVGAGVLPGTGKLIVWNAGADFPGLSSPTCRLRVTADVGQSEVPEGFAAIPAGTFIMGSPMDELGHFGDETQHQVTLTRAIYVSKYEVTQAQWQAVMGWNESGFPGANRPVENVNWYDAASYCNQRSTGEGLTPAYEITSATYSGNHITAATVGWNLAANGYRLPTEAEWEYACRAGSTTAFANGPITQLGSCTPIDPNLNQMAWFRCNALSTTHDVGSKMANAWGLYDMPGNVREWCWDRYASYVGTVTDPVGGGGRYRVIRGGYWYDTAGSCRSAVRAIYDPYGMFNAFGFRPVRSVFNHSVSGILVIDTVTAGTQLLVSNVQAHQRQFTAIWDVTYDLENTSDIAATVSLSLSTDSGTTYPHVCAMVTGDVGAGVLPGTGKLIVWNAGADFPGLSSPTCQLRVTADDGQSEVPEGFVAVPAGTFIMGSPTDETGRYASEIQHQVTLTRALFVSRYEVTQAQWQAVMGWNESHFPGANRPVENVNWYDAVSYCNQLSISEGLTPAYAITNATYIGNHIHAATVTWNQAANGYRLPTEAEWEYACRAGSTTALANGPITWTDCTFDLNLNQMGWYCANASSTTHDVGGKMGNAWGTYDMHGNVYEWCWDWYGPYGGNVTDPFGAEAGSVRVTRGGNWDYYAQGCRSANRSYNTPYNAYSSIGFRPVRSVF